MTASTVRSLAPPATNSYAIGAADDNTTGFTYTDSNRTPLQAARAAPVLQGRQPRGRFPVSPHGDLRLQPRQPDVVRRHDLQLRDAHAVFAMLDTLCSEMGTLIDANAGTLGSSTDTIGMTKLKRTWP